MAPREDGNAFSKPESKVGSGCCKSSTLAALRMAGSELRGGPGGYRVLPAVL
jgi:hypothetical protein